MTDKIKNISVVALMSLIVFGLFITCLIKPADEYSASERRPLDQAPELSMNTILSGDFMSKFEDYTLDQFPLRDGFRTIKSAVALYGMGQLDNNDLYIHDGYITKLEYPYNKDSISYAAEVFNGIYNKLLADKNVNTYLTVVPDKNFFLADESGRLSLDYEALVSDLTSAMPNFEYIDIFDKLTIDDYYLTDTHWKQENILDIAQYLASQMGVTLDAEYELKEVDSEFKGVYYGQFALPVKTDTLKYFTNPTLENCIVYDYQNDKPINMYVFEMATGRDPYEMFLGGALSLVTIENPNAETDKELIIFRDSFGSAIAPLFAEGYAKVTVVDIRYIQSAFLERFIEFDDQDVLFLYSSLVLNNSSTIKR